MNPKKTGIPWGSGYLNSNRHKHMYESGAESFSLYLYDDCSILLRVCTADHDPCHTGRIWPCTRIHAQKGNSPDGIKHICLRRFRISPDHDLAGIQCLLIKEGADAMRHPLLFALDFKPSLK